MIEVLSHLRWPASGTKLPPPTTAEALLAQLAAHFPGAVHHPVAAGVDRLSSDWDITLAGLRGLRHPIVPSVEVLRAPRDTEHFAAAAADATWLLLSAQSLARRLASWQACGWSAGAAQNVRDGLNDAKRAEATLFEAEAVEYVQGRLGRPLPPPTDRPAPEAIFFTAFGSVGVEAKCTAPMNEEEAARVLERARAGDECLQLLAAADRHAWLVFDPACTRQQALDDVQNVLRDIATVYARQLPIGPPGGEGGLSTVRPDIPADVLTLEGWWASEGGADESGAEWSASTNEAKVTLAGTWPAIEARVRRVILEADGQHGDAQHGVTFVRVRPPPFGRDRTLLPRLVDEALRPVANRLRRTSIVCLTVLRPSLVPAATTRRRYGPASALQLVPSLVADTHVEMLFARVAPTPDGLAEVLAR